MADFQDMCACTYVNETTSSCALKCLTDIIPSIFMSSNILFKQDPSLKQALIEKALVVMNFMETHQLTPMCVYHEVDSFLERLKTDLPESSILSEPAMPSHIDKFTPTCQLLSICEQMENIMFQPNPELGTYCSLARCSFCNRAELKYSDEDISVVLTDICRECFESHSKPCSVCCSKTMTHLENENPEDPVLCYGCQI